MSGRPTRIGAIADLNALPLTEALTRWRGGEVRFDVPSALAAGLHRGDLDLALIPQVEIAVSPEYRAIPSLGIACRGDVESILLFSTRPHARIRRVAVDRASRTSVELLRVLFHLDECAPPELIPAPEDLGPEGIEDAGVDALLRIGDRALAARRSTVPYTDLGGWWHQRIDLPFVFALWTGREGCDPALIETVRNAAREGLGRREEIARTFAGENPEVLGERDSIRYLTEVIHHELGEAEEESVLRFAALRREIGSPVPFDWRVRWFEGAR